MAAIQTKEAKILAARADAIRTNALAGAQAVTIVNKASAERVARADRRAGPGRPVHQPDSGVPGRAVGLSERAYLQTLVRATANARKYILLTTNTHDVLQFDLQESIAQSMLSLSVTSPHKSSP